MSQDYFGIDRKKLAGKYYEKVEKGIIKAFSNLYPNNKITVKYKSERNDYYFYVYINGETFAQQELPLAIDTLILVDRYINHLAISLFSGESLDSYIKKCDDYKEENYEWLKNEVDKLIEEYQKQGVIFEDATVSKNRWRIECYHPEKSKKDPYYNSLFSRRDINKPHPDRRRTCNGGYFSVFPFTMGTAKTILNRFKSAIKNCLKGDY